MTNDRRHLQLDLVHPISFYAGQYIEIEAPGQPGKWRCYSIASSPASPDRIELVVKRILGGGFSDQVDRFVRGFELNIRGPYGMGYLRAGNRPVLLVATGSGVAPLLSILRYCAAENVDRSFQFYYGARTIRHRNRDPELDPGSGGVLIGFRVQPHD
jgi:propane monooxygenase reductase subunit